MRRVEDKFYENIYDKEMDLDRVKRIKEIAPFKRIKRELVKGNVKDSGKIIEIGCGLGEYLELFKKAELYGTDISLAALEKAKLYCKRAKFFRADCRKLPLDNESFDSVLLPDIIEHIDDYEKVLDEAARITKKNGRIVIITHFSNRYKNKEYEKMSKGTGMMGEGGDLRAYGLELIDKLKKRGFINIKKRYLFSPLTLMIYNLKEKILERKGIKRGEVLSGKITENKGINIYSKILYLMYKIDYYLFSRARGNIIFLVMEKK